MNRTEPSFADVLHLLRRGFWFSVLLALVAGVTAYLLSERQPETYRSTVTLYVAASNPNLDSFGVTTATAPAMDLPAYASAAVIRPVLVDALGRLGRESASADDLETFRERIDVDVDEGRSAGLLEIHVMGADARVVAREANAIGESLLSWDRRRSTRALQQIITTLESHIAALEQQIADAQAADGPASDDVEPLQSLRADQRQRLLLARTLETSASARVEMFEPAVAEPEPVAPNPVRNAGLTGMLALLLGYAIVTTRHALGGGIRDTDELARIAQRPILAEFGVYRMRGRNLPHGPANFLRTSVQFDLPSQGPHVIVVTSAIADQGTTSVAVGLARSFAHNGRRTLLIDADLRNPVFGGPAGVVGRERIWTRTEPEEADEEMMTSDVDIGLGHRLDVLAAPTSVEAPTEFLTRTFGPLAERAKARYDVVVVNSAPLLPFADTLAIAPHASGIALVVSMPGAHQRDVRAALGLLERSGGRVLGIVANRVDRERGHVGGAGYGYQHAGTAG